MACFPPNNGKLLWRLWGQFIFVSLGIGDPRLCPLHPLVKTEVEAGLSPFCGDFSAGLDWRASLVWGVWRQYKILEVLGPYRGNINVIFMGNLNLCSHLTKDSWRCSMNTVHGPRGNINGLRGNINGFFDGKPHFTGKPQPLLDLRRCSWPQKASI